MTTPYPNRARADHREGTDANDKPIGRKILRPGCRALFFGSPGPGKTFAATLLGKATGREVYKVDLSMVISMYFGETEKSLAAFFDEAEHKD